jgi:Lanthionine synthetase C-like protein
VHALRGHVGDEVLRALVTRVLERTAMRGDGWVNWPPSADQPADLDFKVRVQWCHGAPGIVATLGDLMPLEMVLAAGELIWRAGPLRKGPGLCHGTAGNGYAFACRETQRCPRSMSSSEGLVWSSDEQHCS